MRLQLNDQLRCLDSRLEAQQGQLVELQDIFRRRAEIELNYSRDLEKLGKLVTSRHKEQKTKREVTNTILIIFIMTTNTTTIIIIIIFLLLLIMIMMLILFICSYGALSPQQRSGDSWLPRPRRPAGIILIIVLNIVIIVIIVVLISKKTMGVRTSAKCKISNMVKISF